MNTIKTIFVTVTLLAVGYGTHKVLNSPGDDRLSPPKIWSQNDGIEIPGIGVPNEQPFDLPPLQQSAGTSSSANPYGTIANATPPSGSNNPFAPNPVIETPPPYAATSPMTQLEPVPSNAELRYGNPGRPDLGIGTQKSPSTALPNMPAPAPLQSANPILTVDNTSPPTPLTDNFPGPPMSNGPDAIAGLAPNGGAPPLPPLGMSPPTGPLEIPPPSFGSGNGVDGATMNFQAPITESTLPATPTQESMAAFSNAWQNAQNFIGQGKLADALEALSSVYNLPVNDAQRGQLVSLLDQLAGTVIYSQQHLLHPAYTPRHGETTAQIAMRQRVPADFLARVNGINPHQPLSPDMRLKVVTGPFRGELSRERRELTLFLGKHYAGRFAVSLGNDFPAQSTSFEVFEKSGARAYNDPRTGQQIAAGNPTNPYGAHWIGLRADGVVSTNCGMHSIGSGLDASDSRGCIGLASNDADDLKAILELGSGITVVR